MHGTILHMRKLEPRVWGAFLQWIDREGASRGLYSRDAIANAAGISGSTLGRWANGENGPTLGAVAAVADALGITMAEMGAGFDHARHPDDVGGIDHLPTVGAPLTISAAIARAADLADHERGPVEDAVNLLLRALRSGPGGKLEVNAPLR